MFKKILSLVVVGAITISIAGIASTRAQDSNSGNGLQISPTRTEVTINPGEQNKFTITLKNVTQATVLAKAFLNDFESDGESGTPRIITNTEERTPYSVSQMISGLSDITIQPNETKEVELTVNVPVGTAPGAYFGAVRYAATPSNQQGEADGGAVALTASLAHLVFISVPGDVVEQIQLENLQITNDSGSSSILFSKPEVGRLTVKNLGNGFSRPFGGVIIKNMSGNEVANYEINETDPKGIVLPNSSRIFENNVETISKPGKYTAIASVAYGNGGEVINLEKSFWYLPLWFLGAIAGAILLLAGGGYLGYRKYLSKKYGATRRK